MAAKRRDWGLIFRRAFFVLLPLIFLATPVLTGSILGGLETTLTIAPIYTAAALFADGLTRSVLVALFHTMLYAAPVAAALWPLHAHYPRIAVAMLALWSAVFIYVGFIAVGKIVP